MSWPQIYYKSPLIKASIIINNWGQLTTESEEKKYVYLSEGYKEGTGVAG